MPKHAKRGLAGKLFDGLWQFLARRFTRTHRHFGGKNRNSLSISAAAFWHASCQDLRMRLGDPHFSFDAPGFFLDSPAQSVGKPAPMHVGPPRHVVLCHFNGFGGESKQRVAGSPSLLTYESGSSFVCELNLDTSVHR